MTETNLALNEEKRTVIFEDDHVFNRIYSQLDDMDFFSTKTSALVNGGCGLGKTTALFDERMYKLYAKKLEVDEPKILVIESRALTRDQQNMINRNPNVHCLQYVGATITNLDQYHMIIIDEAHSLFTDSEFAPMTAPLCDWLKNDCHCFQIYVTASDKEFLAFAQDYFDEHEFRLTFPNLDEIHVRYVVQEMIISVNVRKTEVVIEQKEETFFKEGNRGVFFVWSAAEASQLYLKYSRMGYRCGFYISQNNTTQIVRKKNELINSNLDDDDDDDELNSYTSHYIKIDVMDLFHFQEEERNNKGLISLKDSLQHGYLPQDIDYLFITSVGQEGFSLSADNNLNFIFIEDVYPLTINQKLFRYRANIPLAYISLPQRRLEKLLQKTILQLQDMRTWSQDRLRGYYEGTKTRGKNYRNMIWKTKDGRYELSENYIAYIVNATKQLDKVRESIHDPNKLNSIYGMLSLKCEHENVNDKNKKDKDIAAMQKIVDEWDGRPIYGEVKEEFVNLFKASNILATNRTKEYKFDYIRKLCIKNGICSFSKKCAAKKDIRNASYLELNKTFYTLIKSEPHDVENISQDG